MTTISINIEIPDESLADAVYENLWRDSSPWCLGYSYSSYEKDPVVDVTYEDPDTDKPETKSVSIDDLARALETLISNGAGHCGEKITPDPDEWDTCVADSVLQTALFGKIIYG